MARCRTHSEQTPHRYPAASRGLAMMPAPRSADSGAAGKRRNHNWGDPRVRSSNAATPLNLVNGRRQPLRVDACGASAANTRPRRRASRSMRPAASYTQSAWHSPSSASPNISAASSPRGTCSAFARADGRGRRRCRAYRRARAPMPRAPLLAGCRQPDAHLVGEQQLPRFSRRTAGSPARRRPASMPLLGTRREAMNECRLIRGEPRLVREPCL